MAFSFFTTGRGPGPADTTPDSKRRFGSMRLILILSALAVLVTWYGCSCTSSVERANLTTTDSREEFVMTHPEGVHNDCIKNGEIVRGMCTSEVIASWGPPHVYVLTRTSPTEQWVYYVKDRNSLALLVYTLGFADDTLRVWEVDQKRLVGQGTMTLNDLPAPVPVSTTADPGKR
jgi:hypothetical protein